MSADKLRGLRLLVSVVDEYAKDSPSRVWAVVPLDEGNLAKGFKDITYFTLANAVNHAASWLQKVLPPPGAPFETVAYAGPKDIRYPVLAIAAAKVGRKLLLPSPYASVTAQTHLLAASDCRAYLHAAPFAATINNVVMGMTSRRPTPLQVPDLQEWLREEQAQPVLYAKSWEEAKSDPWLVFHTSGTTGLPKLITYTHQMMASLDAAELMPDADQETMNRHFENKRWYTPLPSLHFVGMTVALQFTVFLGSILVVGPAGSGPPQPSIVRDTIHYGAVQGALLPPVFIDSLCKDDTGLESLRNLQYLYFAGAPLIQKTAEKLLGYVSPKPAMGSTEAGAYFLQITGDEDWEYYSFRPAMGLDFHRLTEDLYEPVFVRQPDLERWQQVFQVYPNQDEFHTGDIFSKHPSRLRAWKYVGRTDDMIPFSHGENLYATGIEEIIGKHPGVSAALVGGQSRPRPYLIVEWKEEWPAESIGLEQIWPTVERANEQCSDLVKLTPAMVLFTTPEKPLVRTLKGSVSRRESEQLYSKELELLYG